MAPGNYNMVQYWKKNREKYGSEIYDERINAVQQRYDLYKCWICEMWNENDRGQKYQEPIAIQASWFRRIKSSYE
jgi:hypothetical protein